MKSKTFTVVIIVTFSWWLIIFADQLNRELTCSSTDTLCNSGNTIMGDFTWSLMLWVFSLLLITPIIVGFILLIQKIQNNKKIK